MQSLPSYIISMQFSSTPSQSDGHGVGVLVRGTEVAVGGSWVGVSVGVRGVCVGGMSVGVIACAGVCDAQPYSIKKIRTSAIDFDIVFSVDINTPRY